MTHAVVVVLALLGIAGQAALLLLAVLGALALVGVVRPLAALRASIEGYELWLAFLIAAIAAGGSLFFSEIAGFVPCELCWYQRVCMFPLSLLTLLIALADDQRAARYLLPLPLVGAGVAVYQLLIEHGVVRQSQSCSLSAPGGCATKWINEFGYITIPALTLTGFLLVGVLLLLGWLELGPAALPVEA